MPLRRLEKLRSPELSNRKKGANAPSD